MMLTNGCTGSLVNPAPGARLVLKEQGVLMDRKVYVEIIAKKKGCMLCDLALAILEEIAPEFEPGVLTWEVVDMGAREGLLRHEELDPALRSETGCSFDRDQRKDRL